MKKYWWLILIVAAAAAYWLAKPAIAPEKPASSFAGPAGEPFVNGPSVPPPNP